MYIYIYMIIYIYIYIYTCMGFLISLHRPPRKCPRRWCLREAADAELWKDPPADLKCPESDHEKWMEMVWKWYRNHDFIWCNLMWLKQICRNKDFCISTSGPILPKPVRGVTMCYIWFWIISWHLKSHKRHRSDNLDTSKLKMAGDCNLANTAMKWRTRDPEGSGKNQRKWDPWSPVFWTNGF